VPHWGGITHFVSNSTVLSREDFRKPFGIFLAQLRRLLGLPKAIKGGKIHAHGVPTEQEIANLKIQRTNECIRVTARTLLGLRSLIESLPSSLKVPTRVSDLYMKSVQASESNPFAARRWSELAFFDPELVSVLYFPAEHTYAIYLPLLLPVVVTLLTAFKKQLAIYRRNKALKVKVA
jgi:GPI-anchor transamidase subunit S